MGQEVIPSPYVGLRPFHEEDAHLFFGRERESRIITSNLLQEELTVLYGSSGAGKSPILQAGVLPLLKSAAGNVAVYFNNWQTESFFEQLTSSCRQALGARTGGTGPTDLLDLAASGEARLFLLLDQFEEYLLYHARENIRDAKTEDDERSFESTLAQLINQHGQTIHVLIGLREDALSRLDQRFSIRIPDLLSNTLQVELLNVKAATDAIKEPLRVFNHSLLAKGRHFEIEDQLVQIILEQARSGQTTASESAGKGSSQANEQTTLIETAYLELVLTEIWKAEWKAESTLLRCETLEKMGGASQIVRDHVNRVIATFENDRQRDIAAQMFQYLVTPSRTKIAQRTADLVTYANAPEAEVKIVLNALTDRADARLLRRLSSPEQYEIFHDILAEHILEWRRRYEVEKLETLQRQQHDIESARQQRELEQANALAETQRLRAQEQAAAAARLRKTVSWLRILAAIAVAVALFASYETYQAQKHAKAEREHAEKELSTRLDLDRALSDAASKALRVQAADAQLHGKTQEAERLSQQAAEAKSQVQHGLESLQVLNNEIAQEKQAASIASDRANKVEKDLDQLKRQLESKQKDLDQLKGQLESKQKDFDNERVQLNALQKLSRLRREAPSQLVEKINSLSRQLQTLIATVDIDSSVGGQKKGTITDNPEISGVILVKGREMLRVIGLVPVLRNRAFDMVSDGTTFKLSIPSKNYFFLGPAQEPTQPAIHSLKNLRPQLLFDILLLHEVPADDLVAVENGIEIVRDAKKKEREVPDYVIFVIKRDATGPYLAKKFVFHADRTLGRQLIYDRNGELTTDIRYTNFKAFGGMNFPSQIDVERPLEELAFTLIIRKLEINGPLTDDQFILTQPPGVQVEVLK